jgi:CBS domain-containing protein
MEHLDTFLCRYPPFDELSAEELREAVAGAREVAYEEGEAALVEDGFPSTGLWVVLTGSMDLVHEGEAFQRLEPGECFGHPSLLTGMAPAFTVRAHEHSTCALLSAQAGRQVLGTGAGASYVATSMRKRLTRVGHTVHGLLDVGTTPVSAIMRRAEFCSADATVREAAARLGAERLPALLVELGGADPGRVGIVGDAEVRAAVGGDGGGGGGGGGGMLDAPVRAIARAPVPTVPVAQLAVEATIDMLAAGSEVVAVLDGDRVCGLLSAADLLGLDARSPIALRHTILGAADEPGLVRAVEHLPRLFALLERAGVPPRDLGRVLSLQHDAVVARLIDFSISRHGPAPLPWAWLNLGSAARREFTLASDQDNALAYADPADDEAQATDAYFERLGADVNDGLARCGIGVDNNGVLAGKRLWRMSRGAWMRTFDECLEIPDESHLIRATVAFDFRPAAGGLAVAGELTTRIRKAREYPNFMRLMARTAIGYPVALGFRDKLAVGREGDPPGRLDIKRGAIIPLVNLVRFHALANGVTISNTLDRIEAVAHVGGLERAAADALREAFEVIIGLRFAHHAALIAAGQAPDNLIDPDELAPIARTDLREALASVKRGQKQLGAWAPATR